MPISDVLYLRLADALSQPSRAYRAAKAGLEIPEKALEGYREGGKIGDEFRHRKLAKSSLTEALGGRVPQGLEGFGDLSVEGAGELSKPISAIADLVKANRDPMEKDNTPRSMDAILAERVNQGLLTAEQAYKIKNRGMLLRGGYEETPDGELNPVTGGKPAEDLAEKKGARSRVSSNLSRLSDLYKNLNEAGGIVDTDTAGISNIPRRVASSGVGQGFGKTFGTKNQSVRNQINQLRPLLMNDIRQASKMGAKGLDSEKELEFYLQAATNPSLDIQTNINAVNVLEKAYGLSGQPEQGTGDPEADAAIQKVQQSNISDAEKEARIKGIRATASRK